MIEVENVNVVMKRGVVDIMWIDDVLVLSYVLCLFFLVYMKLVIEEYWLWVCDEFVLCLVGRKYGVFMSMFFDVVGGLY